MYRKRYRNRCLRKRLYYFDTRIAENTALGHIFTDYTVVITADCTHDEVKESFCDRGCGARNTVTVEGSAWGHSFTSYENIKEVSCTEDGIKQAFCDNGCGEKDIVTEEATGRTPDEWIVIEEPTYNFEGCKIQNCILCSDVVNTVAIPVLVYEGFPDVLGDAWYAEGVEYCFKQGYILGNDQGNFDPNGNLTREQFVTILARIAGAKLSEYTESPFIDVEPDSWYGPSVIWASENGYVNGIGDGRFGVGEAMTRATVAVMLYRFAGDEQIYTDMLDGYNDRNSISDWAELGVNWAISNELLGSTSKGRLVFSPRMTLTRAQAAKIFKSFDEYRNN